MLWKSYQLLEIAGRMLVASIRERSERHASALLRYIQRLRGDVGSPILIAATEGELRDYISRIRSGDVVSKDILIALESRVDQIKKDFGAQHGAALGRLGVLLGKAKRTIPGESIDDDRWETSTHDIDWAWKLLGISRSASLDEARKAYRTLAKQYHSDVSSALDSKEKCSGSMKHTN